MSITIALSGERMGATLPDWSGIPDFFHFGNPDSRFFFCSPDQFPIFLFSWSVPDFFLELFLSSPKTKKFLQKTQISGALRAHFIN